MEKLAYCLIIASRRLRHYFQAHPIKQIIHKYEASGRILKWAIELSKFGIRFTPQTAIKRQALTYFINECITSSRVEPRPIWKLYVDESSTDRTSGLDT